jgi:fatty-acid desaturase
MVIGSLAAVMAVYIGITLFWERRKSHRSLKAM